MTHLSILDMKKKIEMYNYVQVCVLLHSNLRKQIVCE